MGFFSFFEDAWNGLKNAGESLIGIFDKTVYTASQGSADLAEGMYEGDLKGMANGAKEIAEAASVIPGAGTALGIIEVTEGLITGNTNEVTEGLGDIVTNQSTLANLSKRASDALEEQGQE